MFADNLYISLETNFKVIWGFPKIRGSFFGGPNIKDDNVLGSTLGSPYFGTLPFSVKGSAF